MATCTYCVYYTLHLCTKCACCWSTADIHNYSYDSGKTARRKPVTRRAVCNPPKKRFSTYSIRWGLVCCCHLLCGIFGNTYSGLNWMLAWHAVATWNVYSNALLSSPVQLGSKGLLRPVSGVLLQPHHARGQRQHPTPEGDGEWWHILPVGSQVGSGC